MNVRSHESLTVADHTKIMMALADRAVLVTANLAFEDGSPEPLDVIDALLAVRSIDEDVRASLVTVREVLPAVMAAHETLPADFQETLETLRQDLAGLSVPDMLAMLKQAQADNSTDELATLGIQFAEAILLDGHASLYSEDSGLTELLRVLSTSDSAGSDIAGVDMIGAAAGGVAGLLTGIGPGTGAVAGAAGASLGAAGYLLAKHLMH